MSTIRKRTDSSSQRSAMAAARPSASALWVVVPPLAAVLIERVCGEALGETAGRLERHVSAESVEAARELRWVLAQVREVSRRRAAMRDAGCVDGTSEPVVSGAEAGSVSVMTVLSAGEVAARWGVSPEYVRRLCRCGALAATRRGRQWSIDATAAEAYRQSGARS